MARKVSDSRAGLMSRTVATLLLQQSGLSAAFFFGEGGPTLSIQATF